METIPLTSYADYIYIFGKQPTDFEEKTYTNDNKEYIAKFKDKGIGILLIDENKEIHKFLEPKKIKPDPFSKKEAIYRIFNRTVEKTIAEFIFQATYELYRKTNNKCAKFFEIFKALFAKEEYKDILNKVLPGNNVLNEMGMRRAFGTVYNRSYYLGVIEIGKPIEHKIYVNDKTKEKAKPPILLD